MGQGMGVPLSMGSSLEVNISEEKYCNFVVITIILRLQTA